MKMQPVLIQEAPKYTFVLLYEDATCVNSRSPYC